MLLFVFERFLVHKLGVKLIYGILQLGTAPEANPLTAAAAQVVGKVAHGDGKIFAEGEQILIRPLGRLPFVGEKIFTHRISEHLEGAIEFDKTRAVFDAPNHSRFRFVVAAVFFDQAFQPGLGQVVSLLLLFADPLDEVIARLRARRTAHLPVRSEAEGCVFEALFVPVDPEETEVAVFVFGSTIL